MPMTDAEKVFNIMVFLLNEGIRAEEMFRVTLSYRTVRYRDCDQLDFLELIQLKDRYEYFNELNTVLGNILYGEHRPRPPYYPLTGLRYDATM